MSAAKRTSSAPSIAGDTENALLARASSQVVAIYERTHGSGTLEIGNYLLDELYGGDAERATARRSKHLTLRQLAQRCATLHLAISKTLLFNGLRVAATDRLLPDATAFRSLSVSHRIELVRLPLELIERIAQEARDEQMTVRELRQVVAEHVGRRGRPAAPGVLLAVRRALRALVVDGAPTFSAGDVAALAAEERLLLDADLDRMQAAIITLRGVRS